MPLSRPRLPVRGRRPPHERPSGAGTNTDAIGHANDYARTCFECSHRSLTCVVTSVKDGAAFCSKTSPCCNEGLSTITGRVPFIGGKADQLPLQIRVGGLLQKDAQVHYLVVIGGSSNQVRTRPYRGWPCRASWPWAASRNPDWGRACRGRRAKVRDRGDVGAEEKSRLPTCDSATALASEYTRPGCVRLHANEKPKSLCSLGR